MIKINYPKDSSVRLAFEQAYVDKLKPKLDSDKKLKKVLADIKLSNGDPLTWQHLLTAPFDELSLLNAQIQKTKKRDVPKLNPLASYKKLHSLIAQFFMEQTAIKLDSCYYCNIDSIYSFSLIGDFKDGLTFMNRASYNQLMKFYRIGDAIAKKIIRKRTNTPFVDIDDCPVSKSIKDDLRIFARTHTHNHFTLDHFLNQADYSYLSLCLYNFVPSCYACNSKYKGAGRLYVADPNKSHPGSSMYSFHKDVTFKLYYYRSDNAITKIEDYAMELEISDNRASHEAYLDRLNIPGRYSIHKREVLRLVKLKEDYPESRIKELSNELGKPMDEVRKQIFGREIFESEYDQSSLVKLKRDIARNIKLLP